MFMHQVSRRGHVYDSVALKNTYTASAETAGPFHKIVHEHCVSRQHIFQLVGLPCIQSFIGGHRAVYFLNVAGRPNDRLAVNDIRHLFQTERIVFNGERSMDSANAIFPSQMRGKEILGKSPDGGKCGKLFTDVCHTFEDDAGDGVWRIRHAAHSSPVRCLLHWVSRQFYSKLLSNLIRVQALAQWNHASSFRTDRFVLRMFSVSGPF